MKLAPREQTDDRFLRRSSLGIKKKRGKERREETMDPSSTKTDISVVAATTTVRVSTTHPEEEISSSRELRLFSPSPSRFLPDDRCYSLWSFSFSFFLSLLCSLLSSSFFLSLLFFSLALAQTTARQSSFTIAGRSVCRDKQPISHTASVSYAVSPIYRSSLLIKEYCHKEGFPFAT